MDSSSKSFLDNVLIRRMRDGDSEALEQWFNLHVDGLYAFIFYRVNKDPDLATEVTQETMALALEELDKFDPARGPMLSWLCMLSRNFIRTALRDKGRTASIALWDGIDESLQRVYRQLDDAPLAPDLLEAKETRELVSVVMTQLPPGYREMLEAKYLNELSLREIAQQQGCSVDSVKGLLKRARAAFKQAFVTLVATTPHVGESGGLS